MTPDSAAADAQAAASESRTIGPALRQLRESRGWSLAEVSARLKFSPRQIEALEGERWSELPKGVSLRGLVRNYARLLGVDPATMMAALEPHIGSRPASPVRDVPPSHGALHQEDRAGGSIAWIVVILAVLAAAVGYAFWQGWLPAQWLSFDWFSRATP